jgi:hypothetical protein
MKTKEKKKSVELPKVGHTLTWSIIFFWTKTWSIISHNEPNKLAEDNVRILTCSIGNQRDQWNRWSKIQVACLINKTCFIYQTKKNKASNRSLKD